VADPLKLPLITRAECALLATLGEARARRETGLCLVEGRRQLAELLEAGCAPRLVAVQGEPDAELAALLARARRVGADVVELDERAARRLSAREQAPGLLAAVPQPEEWHPAPPAPGPALLVALCGLQDPGNVGTLLRSALAFGATALLLTEGTADPFAPKVVRASAGAALRLPLRRLSFDSLVELGAACDCRLVAAHPPGADAVAPRVAPALPSRCLLLLGHETRGLPELPGCLAVAVPHAASVESLNVAMAGSILLADWYRSHAR